MWKARRHRKGRGIGGRFVKHPPMPFAWVDPRPFIHGGPMTATRYCSALLLMMGASFFSFSNAVQISPYVRPYQLDTASQSTLWQSRMAILCSSLSERCSYLFVERLVKGHSTPAAVLRSLLSLL